MNHIYIPCPGCRRRMINLSYWRDENGKLFRMFRCYNGRHGIITFKIRTADMVVKDFDKGPYIV